jgi:uncharacterized protein YecT (DUF1311 family)
MSERSRLLWGLCIAAALVAPSVAAAPVKAPNDHEIMGELSRRSGLPESNLESLLADCNASQQSIYFCAYRDFVAADMVFKRALAAKEQALPDCKSAIDNRAAQWEKSRDHRCEQDAIKEFGDGSMRPTAQALCATAETKRMTNRLGKISRCDGHQDQP